MRKKNWMSGHTEMDRVKNEFMRENVGVSSMQKKLMVSLRGEVGVATIWIRIDNP